METTYYWSLSVSRAVSQLIMRVNKPKFAYKLVQHGNNRIKTHTKKTINNLTRINWNTQLINKELPMKPDTFLKTQEINFMTPY